MIANKNILVYPVVLHPEDEGYSVEIPDIDMEEYRKNNPKTIRESVTVPEYLAVLGKKQKLNFSAILTEAVKNKLEI